MSELRARMLRANFVYERLDDVRLSSTDCVSFAVMRALENRRRAHH